MTLRTLFVFIAAVPFILLGVSGPSLAQTIIKLDNVSTNRCLNVHGGKDNFDGGAATVYSCARTPDQDWEILFSGSTWIRLKNRGSNRCLNIHRGKDDFEGGRITVYRCSSSPDQQWQVIRRPNGVIKLKNRSTGRCLNLNRGAHDFEGAPATSYSCANTTDQEWRLVQHPLSVYFQNMALLVFPGSYSGLDRDGAINHLIAKLRREKFDIVGLAEVFSDGERDKIADSLRDIYTRGNRVDGPDRAGDPRSDGGLLLLSRHPIISRNSLIFPNVFHTEDFPAIGTPQGDDFWALKGILHARVSIPRHPVTYDFFVTHLQNDDAGGPDAAIGITLNQAGLVEQFVKENTAPGNVALMMGDFNLDALNPSIAFLRRQKMRLSEDLWPSCGRHEGPGITHDSMRDFEVGRSTRPRFPLSIRNLATRSDRGARIDYFFRWPAGRADQHCRMYVETEQFRPEHPERDGVTLAPRDLSDHYGIVLKQWAITLREEEPPF
ncbi:RICIN domain-containing protein [uncultured Roseovarius sp.]|uniref:RICIN domain-containing protein n=1 Tax=uncultured Roseovarius sp. TaxID=293344 RepID=UPI00261779AD|nr:RICIN domain-containing protein [uncultured Roseovarius sp.]